MDWNSHFHPTLAFDYSVLNKQTELTMFSNSFQHFIMWLDSLVSYWWRRLEVPCVLSPAARTTLNNYMTHISTYYVECRIGILKNKALTENNEPKKTKVKFIYDRAGQCIWKWIPDHFDNPVPGRCSARRWGPCRGRRAHAGCRAGLSLRLSVSERNRWHLTTGTISLNCASF